MSHNTNIIRIKSVANALSALNEKVVFVGGATISLYPNRAVFEVRPTDDVDVIVEILSYIDRVGLEERLRAIGFVNDIESGVVCRYRIQGIVVDIMPTDDSSIGFKNKWYPDGFANAVDFTIEKHCTVKVLSAPYFLATKLEAFKGRGKNDGRTSADFEDIVFLLENRTSIWDEIMEAQEKLKSYLQLEFDNLLKHPHCSEWIDCHVERSAKPATLDIIRALKNFVATSL